MGMTIEELIAFCEEEEQNHRVRCKRADDASGYTRSKDKNIRTAVAIREDTYADFYKEISDTMRKYQQLKADYENRLKADLVAMLTELQLEIEEIRTEEPINNGHGICGWEGKWAEDIIQECSKIIQQKINSLKEA